MTSCSGRPPYTPSCSRSGVDGRMDTSSPGYPMGSGAAVPVRIRPPTAFVACSNFAARQNKALGIKSQGFPLSARFR